MPIACLVMVWKGKRHNSKVHLPLTAHVRVYCVDLDRVYHSGARRAARAIYNQPLYAITNTKQKIVCLFPTRFVPPLPSLSFSTRLQREKCGCTQDPDKHYS